MRSASQVDSELSIFFADSCLDRFEELDVVGGLFKLVRSILQSISERFAELPRTDFRELILSSNPLPGIRIDELIQIQLVRSLLPLHPEVHDSDLWFVDVHAVFDLVEYTFLGIIHLDLGISCDKVLEDLAERFFRHISGAQLQLPSTYKVEYGFGH